jgi:hypothetical protein
MTRIVTYSLKAETPNSDEYYRTVSAFADSWLVRAGPQMFDLVTGFRVYRQSRGEPDRSDVEYLFELLALGVCLREHGNEASHMPGWLASLRQRLLVVQNRQPWTENPIKLLRGWLDWPPGQAPGGERRGEIIDRMIAWLKADDETVKAERFEEWRDFFKSGGHPFTGTTIARCLELADEFAKASQEALGKYTENVERFLREEAPKHRHRYDARLLSRTRLEYHLGMLGTELLNQAYRQRFLATRRKMVIVPPCMCAPAEICQAIETPFGAKCQACTPGCRVNQITKLGEKRGFSVTMIPDDVKVFGWGKEAESVGLIGISCVLTNWNGGWETGGAGIPAQGLLLDYVGCEIHWAEKGIPTDTNLKRLQELLGM